MSLNAPKQTAVKNAGDINVAIIAARYNPQLVDALIKQVTRHLVKSGVKRSAVQLTRVPGSNELPIAAHFIAQQAKKQPDVIIALGVVIRGDTIHYELVSESATSGLQAASLANKLPIICGVVVTENEEQARARCLGKINRGAEFAQAALEMAALKKKFSK